MGMANALIISVMSRCSKDASLFSLLLMFSFVGKTLTLNI